MGFVAVVLAVLVALHGYVYVRAVHGVLPTRRGRLVGGAVLALLALTTVAAFVTRRTPGVPMVVPYVGYVWLGVLLYAVLLLAVAEPVRVLLRGRHGTDPSRRRLLSGAVAGTFGSAPVRFGLLRIVWPQAERSSALKPMLVAQIIWKTCWLTLLCVSASPGVRQASSRPVRQRPVSSSCRGRPVRGSTLRE